MSPMHRNSHLRRNRSGFTLIEIMVVIAIAAIVTAMTMRGFDDIRQGNKRTTCQTNLVQIYQAARLYAADESGRFPTYNVAAPAGEKNIGLWALYTFPEGSNNDNIATQVVSPTPAAGPRPLERYVRNVKVLHCPADQGFNDLDADGNQDTGEPNNEDLFLSPGTYNPLYLSYQTDDPDPLLASLPPEQRASYQSIRTTDATTANRPLWLRQLQHYSSGTPSAPGGYVPRPPRDDTVVTWCRFHRMGGTRDNDNVLFYDGTVKLLPSRQTLDEAGVISNYMASQRKPISE